MKRTLSFALKTVLCPAVGWWVPAAGAHSPVDPMSNPVYFDTAQPKNQVTAIYAFHLLPKRISTTAGDLPLGGAVHVIAVQLEWAFHEAVSLVANKDGVVIMEPDNTLNDHTGLADLSAGLKWAFHRGENLTLALRGTVELPTGNDRVLQGNGAGNLSPALLATWLDERWQLAGTFGLTVPFDGSEESLLSYLSLGTALRVTEKLSVLLELNWFRVLNPGNGAASFDGQLGSTVPAILRFEGADFFNLGAVNSDDHPDLVTVAFGASYPLTDAIRVTAGYELPLTSEENSLIDGRLYVKSAFKF